MNLDNYYTVRELAELRGWSTQYVHMLVKRKELEKVRVPEKRMILIPKSSVKMFLERQKIKRAV